MLEAVYKTVPEIYKFCHLSYSQLTELRYGSRSILLEEGTQQGDPIGPLLFCITIQPLLHMLRSEFCCRLYRRYHNWRAYIYS